MANWYDFGTATVASGGTTVTLSAGALALQNIRPGDGFVIKGASFPPVEILTVPTNLTFTVDAWPYAAQTSVAYTIQPGPAWSSTAVVAQDVSEYLAAISGVQNSDTTNTVGTGSKTWNVQPNLRLSVGARVRFADIAAPTTRYMEGVVTSYAGRALTVEIDRAIGSGSASSWNVNFAGELGAVGATGATGATGPTGPTGAAGADGSGLTDGDKGDVIVSAGGTVFTLDNAARAPVANLLINGDFKINQRTFAGGALSDGVYGFDRWKADTGGANISISDYVVTLASGTIMQIIKPSMFGYANLASTAITVSVDTPSADLTITVGTITGTITAGSGRKSVTITTAAGDTGNINVKIAKASGSGVTFGRVKAEVGSVATGWAARPDELDLARLFYRTTYIGIAPGTATDTGRIVTVCNSISVLLVMQDRFDTPMQATPTVTTYSTATGSSGYYRSISAGSDLLTSSMSGLSALGFNGVVGSGAHVVQDIYAMHYTASAEL